MGYLDRPLPKGSLVKVPKGTKIVRTTAPASIRRSVIGRNQTVAIHFSNGAYDEQVKGKSGFYDEIAHHLAQITWAGAGGYWVEVELTDEMLASAVLPDGAK